MKPSNFNIYKIVLFLFVLFVLYVVIYTIILHTDITTGKKGNLKKDGYTMFRNLLSREEIENLKKESKKGNYKKVKEYLVKHPKIEKKIQKELNKKYHFQDYILIIQKSSVHTCHRDYNGDFFNEGQNHPSYTVIIYLEDMEKCLGVIPTSHKDVNSHNVNLTNQVENVLCKKGDMILFNSNLIHVGTINERNDNLRVQMKITHEEDVESLSYYEKYNKVLNQDNTLPKGLIKFQQNLSCMFPYISNLTQSDNIKTYTGDNVGEKMGIFEKLYSYFFYGNSNFYNLPNAF